MKHRTMTKMACLAAAITVVMLGAQPTSAASAEEITGYLSDVSVVSATDAWAVGFQGHGSTTSTWHWDGSTWSQVKSPDPGSAVSELFGVKAISADDVWAVGRYADDTSGNANTLIEHYNGQSWSVVDSPAINGPQVGLFSVSATGPKDVWAVGSLDFHTAIVEHWNGKRWSQVPYGAGDLEDVVAVTPDNAWAADRNGTVGHWDGSSWTTVRGGLGEVQGVSATSSTDVWTVGAGYKNIPVFHYDGTDWTAVQVKHRKGYNFTLQGVTQLSSTDGWAVGYRHRFQHHADRTRPMVKHWNGRIWSSSRLPAGLDDLVLRDVEGSSSSDVWAIGGIGSILDTSAILHWDGHSWSRTV